MSKGLPRSIPEVYERLDALGALDVPQAAVANVGTQTVTGADAAAVATSATTAVNAVGTKLNALLAELRDAGIIGS